MGMGRSHLMYRGGGAEGLAASLRWAVGTMVWIAAAGLGSFGTAAAATLPDQDTTPPKTRLRMPAAPLSRPASTSAATAAAVKVAGAPNLVVEGVSWRPTIIKEGSPIRFDFRVRNAGNVAAPASSVVLYRDAVPFVTQVLPPLAPGAVRNGGGAIEVRCGATATITADAPNQVSESNEADNSWTMKLDCLQTGARPVAPEMTAPATVAAARAARNRADDNGSSTSPPGPAANCSPDLYVRRVEIDPPYPRAFQNYRIKIWAHQSYPDSLAEAPQSFISVRLAGHTTVIDSKYERIGTRNSLVMPDFDWTRSDAGAKNLEVYVHLDHSNTLHECNESNNEFVHPFTVYAENEPMADLQFRGYVHFPMHNLTNRDVDLSGELINQGNAESRPFWLEFDCQDDRDAGTRFTHRVRITSVIPPGGGVVAFNTRIRWTTPGLKVCLVRLDKDDEVIESNENNNEHIGVSVRVDNPPPVQ
jgi:hypothetical protein